MVSEFKIPKYCCECNDEILKISDLSHEENQMALCKQCNKKLLEELTLK